MTAAVADPGTPSASMGRSAEVPAEWSAVSGAITPSGSPLPKFLPYLPKRRPKP